MEKAFGEGGVGCDVLSIPRAVRGLQCCCGHCFGCFQFLFPSLAQGAPNWSDQLSGFYIFPWPDRAIVNCLIYWSFHPEQLNFVVQVEKEEIMEEEKNMKNLLSVHHFF